MTFAAAIDSNRLRAFGTPVPAPAPRAAELRSHEPATGAQFWSGSPGDVEEIVASARAAWPGWASQPLLDRIGFLRAFTNEVRREGEALATAIARETGKPLREARSDVETLAAQVEVSVSALAERNAQRRRDNALHGVIAVRHKPHGVVTVLGPSSSPMGAATGHIVPALIAGNVVILKPSEKAPGCAEALVRCFYRAGVPASVLQVCHGGPETGASLVAHDGVDGVMFTGSTANGLAINRRLAARPDRFVSLAMGGNNPCVVWDTPKLSDAAALVVQSAFTCSGQTCTAVRRLIVRDTIAGQLLAEIKAIADRLIVGGPCDDPQPWMGPMIDNAAAEAVSEAYVGLLGKGGRPIKHLVRLDPALPYLSPAIIDVTDAGERPDLEIFGPVLQVVRVSTFEDAIAEANATRFGLGAMLVGGSAQDDNRFWANVRAGMVNWNRPLTQPWLAAPQGGVGLSGNFRPGGTYAADTCAYPVTSGELDQPRAAIGVGLRDLV